MLHLNHRIATLFCLSLSAFACDVDDRPGGLDEFEVIDDLDARDDEPDALDDGHGAPQDGPDEDLTAIPGGNHCIVEATAVSYGVDPATVRAADKPVTCFPTFADSIFAITGERMADDVTPETYEPGTLITNAPGAPRANYVHGIEYQYDNWDGKSLTIYGSGTCLTASWTLSKFSDSWWDNRVTSARAYSGCKHSYHYEDKYLGGAVKDCGTSCWYIGAALQNRTSSIRWTK